MGCFDLTFEEASFRWKVRLANVLEFSWNLKSTFFWCVGGGGVDDGVAQKLLCCKPCHEASNLFDIVLSLR